MKYEISTNADKMMMTLPWRFALPRLYTKLEIALGNANILESLHHYGGSIFENSLVRSPRFLFSFCRRTEKISKSSYILLHSPNTNRFFSLTGGRHYISSLGKMSLPCHPIFPPRQQRLATPFRTPAPLPCGPASRIVGVSRRAVPPRRRHCGTDDGLCGDFLELFTWRSWGRKWRWDR
ncbi:hypothetical protein HPP92_023239 [Vanilla planifolia]|uniref:Uncharacterized protein n=1 Tax=Vanilla planifolia TaxID=51239 RepID=A0A835PY38_VANPL|nr:hypothetical protein HPP92_023239 [Vanilla planifolia]